MTHAPDAHHYATALGLVGEPIAPNRRLRTLLELRDAYDVRVLTGPEGAAFWGLASLEVLVDVVPDGYRYKERLEPDVWAGIAAGCSGSEARELANKYLRAGRTPTKHHRLSPVWSRYVRFAHVATHAPHHRDPRDDDAHRAGPRITPNIAPLLDDFRDHAGPVALDWEWDIRTEQPFGLSLAYRPAPGAVVAIYIPIAFRRHAVAVRRAVADYLRAPGHSAPVFHGGRADLSTQDPAPLSLVANPPHDTLVAAYLCGEPELGLKKLTRSLLKREALDYPEGLPNLPLATQARYAVADAVNTLELWELLEPRLATLGQRAVYDRFEQPLVPVIAEMERTGCPVDVEELRALYSEFEQDEEATAQAILGTYGYDFYDEADQARSLTAVLGFDLGTLRKEVIGQHNHEWARLVMSFRTHRYRRRNILAKALERYDRWASGDHTRWHEEFRTYTTFNQAGTVDAEAPRRAPKSGRLSSGGDRTNPESRHYRAENLQNQTERVRRIYVPPTGENPADPLVWWAADWSTLEVCISAAVSGDRHMQEQLAAGVNMHGALATLVFAQTGVEPSRDTCKRIIYGKQNGGHVKAIQRGMVKQRITTGAAIPSREVIEATLAVHEQEYPEFTAWIRDYGETCAERGWTETLNGRRYYDPQLASWDAKTRGGAMRSAISIRISGTAADYAKAAMIEVARDVLPRYPESMMVIQVHDELCGWCRRSDADRLLTDVSTAMTGFTLPGGVDLKVSTAWAENWAAAH